MAAGGAGRGIRPSDVKRPTLGARGAPSEAVSLEAG